MKFSITVNDVKSIHEISGYWNDEDFISILEELDVADAKDSKSADLRELFYMAMSDFEPPEAAAILLKYKLGKELNAGQIQNIAHEMVDDNESEDNADIALHYALFNINQLLYRAFNGTFPNAKATQVDFKLNFMGAPEIEVSKELVLKALCCGLSDNSPIPRLFEDELAGNKRFDDAKKIVWELHESDTGQYRMITSDYWISKQDFVEREFSGTIKLYATKGG